ncbi:PIN domain-containing protein, partial [Methylobacterium aquaticum]
MDTYLLDTNLVSVLYDAGRPNNRAVRAALAAFDPAAPQLVSAITIGELRFGLALSRAAGRPLDHIEAC